MLKYVLLFLLLISCGSTEKPKQVPHEKITTFVVDEDLYHTQVLFLLSPDTLQARDFTRSLFNDTSITGDDFFKNEGTTFENGGYIMVWLPKAPESTAEQAVLSHELLHVTIGILRRVGIPLAMESEEAYTYLIQHLTNNFYKQIQNDQHP